MRISVLSLGFLLFLGACSGGAPQAPNQNPNPAVPNIPPPPNQRLNASPNYCQALVTPAEATALNRFVVDTYNKKMRHIPGFRPAQLSPNGQQPIVTFATLNKPSLYYPNAATPFHTTLCNAPDSSFFRCADGQLLGTVSAGAKTNDAVSAFSKYFKDQISPGGYTYSAPESFGPLFVALPLQPREIQGNNGQVVSGRLHVSLVKIWSSNPNNPETPTSARLKAEFVQALHDEFASLQALLPPQITFDSVLCRP